MAASPTPAATDEQSLLVYDGDCGFCTSLANRFADLSGIAIAPWQSLDLDQLGLTVDDVSTAVYYLENGRAHRGTEAVSQGLIATGGGWTWAGRLLTVPPLSWLARAAYPVIARNRHRLPGSTDACRLDA